MNESMNKWTSLDSLLRFWDLELSQSLTILKEKDLCTESGSSYNNHFSRSRRGVVFPVKGQINIFSVADSLSKAASPLSIVVQKQP